MKRHSTARRGLSLIECLMLVAILSIVGTTAGRSLMAITKIPKAADSAFNDEMTLVSTMEHMRALAYDNLTVGTAITPYSNAHISVDVDYADPRELGMPSLNWKKITVRLPDGRQLTTYVSKP
jgi:type II secretory pathway pseudopilin PulG